MARNNDRKKDEQQDDMIDRLVSVNRVAKTVKGGRRMSFAALMVVGDGKGRVGYASCKAKEVPDAIQKASKQAKAKMVRIPLREGRTLHHDVESRTGSVSVVLRAAPSGTGIIAGGPLRAIFEALGVQDVVAKTQGSNNPHNMIHATIDALSQIESPRSVAARRSMKVADVLGRYASNDAADETEEAAA